jgi:hypothetical protein
MTRAFKRLDELTKIDDGHVLLSQITGRRLDLQLLYEVVSRIELHAGVPEDLRGQFNVARNMALYTYFFYDLAPEVQLKTYTIIELSLRQRSGSTKIRSLKALLTDAVDQGWISDRGFRHIADPAVGDPFCRSLVDVLPKLRNEAAHGSTNLSPDTIMYLERCADLVNQLYSRPESTD